MTVTDRYFAYGSNMSLARIRSRIPEAEMEQTCTLAGYRLAFHKRSLKDGSAKCDAHLTGDQTDLIRGVVFHVPSSVWPALDDIEGPGYARRELLVSNRYSQTVSVQIYIALLTDPALRPFQWYKHHVLYGARENGFPEDYLRSIESVPAIPDPDIQRATDEMSIYL